MPPANERRPLIALTIGDPSGIGPELVAAVVRSAELAREMRLLVLAPRAACPRDLLDRRFDPNSHVAGHVWLATDGDVPAGFPLGVVHARSGRAALEALRMGAELASSGVVDALVTAPVSKEALHLAGEEVQGQTELLARWAGAAQVEMLALGAGLRVLVLTRHLALRQALDAISTAGVVQRLECLHLGLAQHFAIVRPRIALAGLNPHAGEAGLLGREELELLQPAVRIARGRGIDVAGPISPDSVFVQARAGEFDAVLALYHDQGFIPLKLAAPETGTTLLLGLPYLRLSPAHGTAFGIAGRGLARATNLIAALREARGLVQRRGASAQPPARSRANAASARAGP